MKEKKMAWGSDAMMQLPGTLALTIANNSVCVLVHCLVLNPTPEAGTLSVVTYTPMTELDYGTLLCVATNRIGKQRVPCAFHVIAAGNYWHNGPACALCALWSALLFVFSSIMMSGRYTTLIIIPFTIFKINAFIVQSL